MELERRDRGSAARSVSIGYASEYDPLLVEAGTSTHLDPSLRVWYGSTCQTERITVRKLAVALAVGAIGVAVAVSPAAAQPTGGLGEPTCRAAVISFSVKEGPGRRAVAESFFGDYPQAVRDAERALKESCASQ
jgi:hypothetical protein